MTRPTEAEIQAGLPGQIRGHWPPVPRWARNDGGQVTFEGRPLFLIVRAVWGEDYTPAATLDRIERTIVDLLNAEGVEA